MAQPTRLRERDPNMPDWAGRTVHRPAIWRDVGVILVTALVVVVAASLRLTPNEDLPPAQALTDSMDDVYEQVRSGTIELGPEAVTVAPDVEGAHVDGARWAVAGEFDDVCYSMWWGDAGIRRVRTIPWSVACTPANGASDSRMNVAAVAPAAPPSAPSANWGPLLPDPMRVRVWWLPLVLVAAALMLSAFVRIVVMLVTGRSVRGMR